MSQRAEALANTFEQANQSVIEMVEASSDLSVACPAEGWTAAADGAHVGGSHFGIVEYLLKPIVAGQEIAPPDLNAMNAKAAADNATLPKDEVVKLLRDHGVFASAYLRTLSDEDLDRTANLPMIGPEPVAVQQLIEMVLIGHPLDHGQSLRQGLGHADHEHAVQGVTA